jgi:hypothetical protein
MSSIALPVAAVAVSPEDVVAAGTPADAVAAVADVIAVDVVFAGESELHPAAEKSAAATTAIPHRRDQCACCMTPG